MSDDEAATNDAGLDHLIIRVPQLDHAIEAFDQLTGVTPMRGGQHPGRGTENALVSLGSGHYLELMAPIERNDANAADTLRLGGWALRTRDLTTLGAQVATAGLAVTPPQPGSRRTPGGALLEWRTSALLPPGIEGAPFLIEWGSRTPHPSGTSPEGCRLLSVDVETPEAERMSVFLRTAGSGSPVRQAARWRLQATLMCPTGRVIFTS
jgi:hypothetical protein